MAIIPKEQLGGFQRWQITSFDQPPVISQPVLTPPPLSEVATSSFEETVSAPPLPTAEEIERIHEEARKAGYEAGLEEGRAAAKEEAERSLQEGMSGISSLINEIEHALGELDQAVAEQLLQLALEVARQLSLGAIKAQPDYLLPLIRESIASLPLHHAHIILHLHPDDAPLVRSGMAESITQNNLQIQENPDITRGGCRIMAGSSEIDAGIETRWSRVLEAIGAEPQKWLT